MDSKLRTKIEHNRTWVFDICRNKYVVCTPEEEVRQLFLLYLINQKAYPKGLIAVEAGIKLHHTDKRCDIIVYNRKGEVAVLIECKAPSVTINGAVFEQAVQYNIKLQAQYLVVTNGQKHFVYKLDYESNKYLSLKDVPAFSDL